MASLAKTDDAPAFARLLRHGDDMAYERVHMIWEYWEGPRSGIADCGGRPFHFSGVYDEHEYAYTDSFVLTPFDEGTFALAQEEWAIWRRWEADFHAGRVLRESHPSYGHYDPRYNELRQLLNGEIEHRSAQALKMRGEFRPAVSEQEAFPGQRHLFEVEWSPAD